MPRQQRSGPRGTPKPIPGLYTAPYLDSAVFIGWVMGEVDSDGYDRGDIGQHILLLAEMGYYKVYISSLTLAEVFKPKGYDPLKPTQNQRLLDYFERDFIEMVLIDRDVGLDANWIAATHGLNPNDAIHVACARRAGCDVVLTWDKPFLNKTVPGVTIQRPEKRGQQVLPLETADPR